MAKAPKTLENGSKFESFDVDGDGVVTDAEIAMQERLIDIENRDKKEDAQRNMAWIALFGMISYPLITLIADFVGMSNGAKILGEMASLYFIAVAGIVAAFYGKEAYMSKK